MPSGASKWSSSEAGTLVLSSRGVYWTPASAIRDSPAGPLSTTAKSRVSPSSMIGRTSSVSCWVTSVSVGGTPRSRSAASAVTCDASLTAASSRCSSNPSRVCWTRNQPTIPITSAESSTTLTTTRAWMDRRQKVRARFTTSAACWRPSCLRARPVDTS